MGRGLLWEEDLSPERGQDALDHELAGCDGIHAPAGRRLCQTLLGRFGQPLLLSAVGSDTRVGREGELPFKYRFVSHPTPEGLSFIHM